LACRAISTYKAERMTLGAGDRVCLFSDGLIEQPNPDGELFGLDRTIAAIAGSGSARDDVRAMAAAVREHADTDVLADDFTVASVHYSG
jgi:sigma-B regulation protein RsbU (phosphoserine phosphatase)